MSHTGIFCFDHYPHGKVTRQHQKMDHNLESSLWLIFFIFRFRYPQLLLHSSLFPSILIIHHSG